MQSFEQGPEMQGSKVAPHGPLDRWPTVALSFALALIGVVIAGALFLLIERHEIAEKDDALVQSAMLGAETFNHLRTFYSQSVFGPVADESLGELPLPATFSIEFGDYLTSHDTGMALSLFSAYPFPMRTDRVLDDFQLDSLDAFSEPDRTNFFRFYGEGSDRTVRYAVPVFMQESCVACHNSRDDSPFREWEIGDLRGVQEVAVRESNLVGASTSGHSTFRDIMLFVVGSLILAFASIAILLARNKAAFVALREHAGQESQRSSELTIAKSHVDEAFTRLEAVLDNVADAIVTIDATGKIETVNDATEHLFGYTREELIGANVSLLAPPDVSLHHDGYLKRYLLTGQKSIIGIGREVEGRRKDGSVFPLELSVGEVVFGDRRLFTGILRDISDRRKADQELRASEEQARKLSMVAARTDNAVIITDADGRVEWVNDGFTRLSGYSMSDVAGRTPGEVLQSGEVDQEARQRMSKAIRCGEPFAEQVLNYTSKGEPYWVEIEAQPIFGADGEVVQFMAIERDVTSLKEHRKSLEAAIARTEEANKAKSRFLAMMSHEIRTPLNGVLGGLDLLSHEKLDNKGRELVDLMSRSAQTLLSLINDILDFSKMEAGKLELGEAVFDPTKVAEAVAEILSTRANEKGIRLELELSPNLPMGVIGDPSRLRQILLNLAGNAVKFTDVGQVLISVELEKVDDSDAMMVFSVVDTGVGIAEEDLASLFDEFWVQRRQSAEHAGGTGLGLAITKTLVEMMGGTVAVTSKPGEGSSFVVRLPFPIAHGSSPSDAGSRSRQPVAERETLSGDVLVVEDNRTNQLVIHALLERLGISPVVVSSGAEALDAVQTKRFDLVLMDIGMPEMDGIEATHCIRELGFNAQELPVIAMTAFVMAGDREGFLAQGLDDYIPKPIDAEVLKDLLKKWLLGRTLPAPSYEEAGDHRQNGLDLFDASHLDALSESLRDEAVVKIIETFRQEAQQRLDDLTEAARNSNLEEVAKQAHPLKSSAASLGALTVADLARDLEVAGRMGDVKPIDELVRRLKTAITDVGGALDGWISSRT